MRLRAGLRLWASLRLRLRLRATETARITARARAGAELGVSVWAKMRVGSRTTLLISSLRAPLRRACPSFSSPSSMRTWEADRTEVDRRTAEERRRLVKEHRGLVEGSRRLGSC